MTSHQSQELPIRATRRSTAAASSSTSESSRSGAARRTSGRAHRVLHGSYQEPDDDLTEESDHGTEEGEPNDDSDSADDAIFAESDGEVYSPAKHTPKRPRAANNGYLTTGRKRTHLQASSSNIYPSPSQSPEETLHKRQRTAPSSSRGSAAGANPPSTPPRRREPASLTHSSLKKKAPAKKASPSKAVVPLYEQPRGQPIDPTRPAWGKLPYLILQRIFQIAAENIDCLAAARWLACASRTCRSFSLPALEALYSSPPLLSMNMAHSFSHHIAQDPSKTTMDYRVMVKALHIDVGSLASRVYKGRYLDLGRLVSNCPRLAHIDLYHYKDLPPYKNLTENLRYSYPPELFEALGAPVADQQGAGQTLGDSTARVEQDRHQPGLELERPTLSTTPPPRRLVSWTWNRRLVDRNAFDLDAVKRIHMSTAFHSLRKLRLVNFQRPSLGLPSRNADDAEAMAEDKTQAETMADVSKTLPQLTHLIIESSTSVNEYLLPLLPTTLQNLELINCWDVTAEMLAEYLLTHGEKLLHLTLHHNQSLSLSFLPILAAACPKLRSLRMNLTYYSHHASYNDSDPLFESLLYPDQVPTWPSSLQTLELEHLRKWEPEAAAHMFQSLVDSAPDLQNLRTLAIKATLDMPWRQRCQMRDQWEAELVRVFRRRSADPEPANNLQYYARRRRFFPAGGDLGMDNASSPGKNRGCSRPEEPSRRSTRIATTTTTATHSRSSSHASSTLRSNSGRGRVSYREPDTDDDDFSEDGDKEEEKKEKKKEDDSNDDEEGEGYVQGLCELVDIRIDNQKPNEIQYSMGDFLDSDNDDSDGEWTGDEVENAEYAW